MLKIEIIFLIDARSFTNSVCFVIVKSVKFFKFFISPQAGMINITTFKCKLFYYRIY